MKLFARYNRLTLSATVLIFLAAGILYYILLKAVLVHELDEALMEKKKQVIRFIHTNGRFPPVTEMDETIFHYQLSDAAIKKSRISSAKRFDREEGHEVSVRELTFTENMNGQRYQITIAKALEGTSTLLKYIIGITLSIILLIILVTVFINRYLLRRLWQPFYLTLRTIQDFKVTDNRELHFPSTNTDEFTLLNQHLVQTIGNAQREYRLLKEFTENASHETQTPLAILRSKLDLFIQSEDLAEKQIGLLKAMYDPIRKLSRLNQSLLLLMKIGNRQFPSKEIIDLRSKVEEKIGQFAELWQDREISLTASLSNVNINANPELTDILLNNLFSNATRHNVPGGNIHIILDEKKLTIGNLGTDHALDPDRIFQRFFKDRPEASSNGLGLAIIKEIAQASGFTVRYDFINGSHYFHVDLK